MRPSSSTPDPSRRRLLVVALALIAAVAGVVGLTVLATTRAATAPTTIWGTERPPGVELHPDPQSAELGTMFIPTVGGLATGIRFYKAEGATGKHTGTLWTEDGEKLAEADFVSETSSGWQTAALAKPVELEADRTYVVSYRVPEGGGYGVTVDHSGGSHSDALDVGLTDSGVFDYESHSAVPRSTWRSSQYWVDVTFVADATPPPQAALGVFPTRETVGLPDGWAPEREMTGEVWIREAGAVIEDVRYTDATIYVEAPNVTLRRIQAVDARIVNDYDDVCKNGLLVEDSEFTSSGANGFEVIGPGGYTVRNTAIDGVPEGLRAGGKGAGCETVTVEFTFIRITPPKVCGDWHGDGIQGYDGPHLIVRQSTILMEEEDGCHGTAPFFYPSGQENTSVDIDGLIVSGGGYSFRNGMPGSIRNLNVVDGGWGYAPVDVRCSVVQTWQARVVTLDAAGQPVPVSRLRCSGDGG
ncbi:DUF4082 domain-containing protein [Agromyces cerinus]|uniref:DUF4082 domain-containing protein n=1 Tax=Agromyces cerinus TaxID=33878 RepID=UPI0013566BB4|nr:DUF4082 domain-containing protein [Agromyces cerinus]